MCVFPLPVISSVLKLTILLDGQVEQKLNPQRYLFWSSLAGMLNSSLLLFLCLIYYTVMYKHLQENIN